MRLRCYARASKRPLIVVVVVAFARQLFVTDQEKLIDGAGKLLGASLSIDDPKSQSRALSLVGSVDWIQARPVYLLFADPNYLATDILVRGLQRLNGTLMIPEYLCLTSRHMAGAAGANTHSSSLL